MKSQEKVDTKIGSGHVRAMAKQGLEELRAALYPGSNIAQPTGYGVFGKETPGEVAQQRENLDADQEPKSVLGERLEAAEAKRDAQEKGNTDKGRDDKGHEPERT
jgi:hypothetical protein